MTESKYILAVWGNGERLNPETRGNVQAEMQVRFLPQSFFKTNKEKLWKVKNQKK